MSKRRGKGPGRTDWARVDAMTDEEVERRARRDPDCPPMTERDLARMHRPTLARRVRLTLGLSQRGFSNRFGIPLSTLREWEQGRRTPNVAVLLCLRLIQRNPKAAEEEAHRIAEGRVT